MLAALYEVGHRRGFPRLAGIEVPKGLSGGSVRGGKGAARFAVEEQTTGSG